MKFGKSYDEISQDTSGETGAGGWIKNLKDGDNTFQIVQEPEEWVGYWEHYNPGGFPFPCTGDRKNCPGCVSSNEKMKKASRKIAFNVLEGTEGYVNVYKVPKTVADKLANRAERLGTITDREYTITRLVSKVNGRDQYDFDVESGDKREVDRAALELRDVETMLAKAYDDAWGDGAKAKETEANAEEHGKAAALKDKLAAANKEEAPPFEENDPAKMTGTSKISDQTKESTDSTVADGPTDEFDYTEDALRQLKKDELAQVLKKEGMKKPRGWASMSEGEIVDWLLEQDDD